MRLIFQSTLLTYLTGIPAEYKRLLVLNTSDIRYFGRLRPSQVLYTCNRDPLGGPRCSVKHSQSLETTPTPFLFGTRISYGSSVDLNDRYLHHATLVHRSSHPSVVSPFGRLTLRSSHLSVVSPLVTPLPIFQSIHRPISPLPFLLCHHLTLPLSATFSAKNTHSPTSDSLSYPVSGSVS